MNIQIGDTVMLHQGVDVDADDCDEMNSFTTAKVIGISDGEAALDCYLWGKSDWPVDDLVTVKSQ